MTDTLNINNKTPVNHANRLTQIGAGLLAIITGLIMTLSITAPMYVSSMLKEAGLSAAISHRLMDTVFDSLGNADSDVLAGIQNSIENSRIIDKLADKYTNAIVMGMLDGKEFSEINVDIDPELDELADMAYNGISDNIKMGDIQKTLVKAALTYSENAAKDAINNYVKGIYDNIYNRLSTVIKVYSIITSMTFKIIVFILYVVTLVLIIATNPARVSEYTLPVIFILTGLIYMLAANVIGNRYVVWLSNRYLGRAVFIDSHIAYKVMAVMCVFAILSYILILVCSRIRRNQSGNNI